MNALSASVRRRMARRRVVPWIWWQEPIISAYADRLRDAAIGDHSCILISVPIGRGNDARQI